MAIHLKTVVLTCLLLLMVVMENVKPVLAKRGRRLRQRIRALKQSVTELKETVRELKQEMKEQEKMIKALNECKGKYSHCRS